MSIIKSKSRSTLFMWVFALCILFGLPTQHRPVANNVIEFSSFGFNQNACYSFYENKRPYFNLSLFKLYKAGLAKREALTDDEIKRAYKTPEHFLAVIETLSAQESYLGFNFEDRLQDLPPRKLKKLQSTLLRYTKEDSLSKNKFTDLLVAVYRIAHQPKGFVRSLYDTRDINAALDRMDDNTIRQRIEASLFNETMEETFRVIISDPKKSQVFKKFVKDNAPWIDLAVFGALWGSTIVSKLSMGIDIDLSPSGVFELLPPYLPGAGLLLKITLNKEDLQTARTRGLRKAIEDAKERLGPVLSKSHKMDFLRFTYSSIFTGIFLFTTFDYFYHREERISAAMSQLFSEQVKSFADEVAAESRKTDLQRAEESFQAYLKILDAQGTKYDINSPEIQAIKQRRIELFKNTGSAMDILKKQNPN